MKRILLFIFLIAFSYALRAQTAPLRLDLYWGNVTSLSVTPAELQQYIGITVSDTLKFRKILSITKIRFIMQPMMDGPVKVAESTGPDFTSQMKEFIKIAKPGDRIVISDIFGIVETEGKRQLPAAAVFEVK